MFKILTPRSLAALAVVAASFFLMVCVARYGGEGFANARAAQSPGFAALVAGWLVQTIGAGVWALVLLPLAWGVIVYFDERTPDLPLRFAGTVVLAVSVSTLVGLAQGGLWAGHAGNAVAGALGGLPARLGGFGTGLAWLITLTLAGVSLLFATDWMFRTLRRAGRDQAAEAPAVATEPAAAELLDDPAEAEPREFVVETPRAAVAAAKMDEIAGASPAEAFTPDGWDETESEGRTVIAAPTGYRGVEFLPQSDELAVPGTAPPPRRYAEPVVPAAPDESLFHDEHFVATSDAAYFVETPDVHETETQEIDPATPASAVAGVEEDPVSEAVAALFQAVTTPETAPETAPASGIGLPDDSPFKDEYFPADAGWPYASAPDAAASDGASAAHEMAASFGSPAAAPEPSPELELEPEPVAASPAPSFDDDQIVIEEFAASRLPGDAFDDALSGESGAVVAPAAEPVAEESAVEAVEFAAAPEPAPQLSLFSEPAAAATSAAPGAVATMPEVELARLHAMELDPLFHDAMNAVLDRGRASAVVLQRHLGIGYARGIRILDQMTTAGLVGPDTPSGTRQIRVSREAWNSFTA